MTGITDLPFVADLGTGKSRHLCFWHVSLTDDRVADLDLGADYALAAVKHIRENGDTPLLADVVGHMPCKDERSGIEIGFLEAFALMAAFSNGEGAYRRWLASCRAKSEERERAQKAARSENARKAAKARWEKPRT